MVVSINWGHHGATSFKSERNRRHLERVWRVEGTKLGLLSVGWMSHNFCALSIKICGVRCGAAGLVHLQCLHTLSLENELCILICLKVDTEPSLMRILHPRYKYHYAFVLQSLNPHVLDLTHIKVISEYSRAITYGICRDD